jgi:hypothetical protein
MKTMRKTFDKIIVIVAILFVLSLIFIFIKTSVIDPSRLVKEHRYTIAKITKVEAIVDGGLFADFTFRINNKCFQGGADLGHIKVIEGDRYFLKYYTKNPNNCYILFENPVPLELKEAPPEGWITLPILGDKSK